MISQRQIHRILAGHRRNPASVKPSMLTLRDRSVVICKPFDTGRRGAALENEGEIRVRLFIDTMLAGNYDKIKTFLRDEKVS